MRQPSKATLMQENAELRKQRDAMWLLLTDLVRGEAAIKRERGVTWLISRPGSAASGCALMQVGAEATCDVGYVEDLARVALRQRSDCGYRAEPGDLAKLEANASCATAALAVVAAGYAANCAPKLPVLSGGFRRVKL